MKVDHTIIVLTVFLSLAVFSGFLVLNDDSSKVEVSQGSETQLDKIASEEGSFKEFSGAYGDNIIQKVEVPVVPFKSQEYWSEFETVTINIQEFENAAENGVVDLRLLERDFEVEIKEISRLNGGKSYRYSGHIKGIPQSKATFYVFEELFSGSVEFQDLMYNIAVTSEKYNGKTVHMVFAMDWKKDRERLKSSLNPLSFIFAPGSAGNSSEIKNCMIDEDGIFEKAEFDRHSFEISETCEDFEIVIVNPQEFRESASNGAVNISLMEKCVELELNETSISSSETTYAGYVTGNPQSSAVFVIGNDTIDGFINIGILSYAITATDKKCNGKTVHLICRRYNEGAKEKLGQELPDPLQFFLRNEDKVAHEISIGILDFYNESIFYRTYSLSPGNEVSSPEIIVGPGIYRYEITLDGNFASEQEVRAEYTTEPVSSEKLHIDLIDQPEYPMTIRVEST